MKREAKKILENILNKDLEFKKLFEEISSLNVDKSIYKVTGRTILYVCSHCESPLIKINRIPEKEKYFYCPTCKNLR